MPARARARRAPACRRSRRGWRDGRRRGGRPGRGPERSAPRSRATPARPSTALADVAAGTDDRLVAFVGKLIVSKGIDLLVAAWPLVLQREPRARLVVVGFGAYRAGCERLIAALADGDLATLDALVAAGRAEEGGPQARRSRCCARSSTRSDDAARADYLTAAAACASASC